VLALGVLGIACGPARGDPAPTAATPVVVAGKPVALEQARQRAGHGADPDLVDAQLMQLVHARWVAGEAARHGVMASPARVRALVAREQRSAGGAAAWRRSLARQGVPEAEARSQLAEQALREALLDTITAGAHGNPRRWGRAVDQFNRHWRAQTVCAVGMHSQVRASCGNVPQPKRPCAWTLLGDAGFFPLGELCWVKGRWFVNLDLIEQFHPNADPADLACVPDGDRALARVRRYVERTAPRVARQVFFDEDCDPQLVDARSRTAVITVLHAVARIGARARAK
jgi:hypothetical protein